MNRVFIEPTKFANARTGDESFGWRAFDGDGQAYDNTWKREEMPTDDLAFLKRVLETSRDETLWAMLSFCEQYERGLYVGNTFITWPRLLPLLETIHAK